MLDDFMLRAALAGIGVALAAAPLGCFVIWRRMAYFGDATSHAAILGVALALATDLPILAGVLVVALAMAAGRVPNEATPAHFEALKAHFSDRQIVQIVAVIAMFGFLNRWNDTMATELEDAPVAFAEKALATIDWAKGKHG